MSPSDTRSPHTMSTQKSASKPVKLTPMMQQYRAIHQSLPPDTILFFRLGDFYEMFFEDAVKAADILDITLTGRGGGDQRIPMCGIPYHSFQGYIRKLLDQNLKVAICEQIGDPKAGKGLVERKVTRIITPATFIDEPLKANHPEYIAAVVGAGENFNLAYLDLTTGEFAVRELAPDRLAGELLLLQAREIVLPESLNMSGDLDQTVREQLGAAITRYEDWVFSVEESTSLLMETFRLGSLRSLGLEDNPGCLCACGALLYYLKDHLHEAVEHIRPPRVLMNQDYMILDRQTQQSLELVKNLHDRSSATLFACIDKTGTSMGKRQLYQWVTRPLLKREPILLRQRGIQELIHQNTTLTELQQLLSGMKDIERLLSRLNYGVANAQDLLHLNVTIERIPELKKLLAACESDILKNADRRLREFPHIAELIGRAIVAEPPVSTKDGGMLQDGYSPELDELRDISRNGKQWLLDYQKKEMQRTGIKSLKVKYSQVFGYSLEVSKSNLASVPEDYTRRQTMANAERFVTQELAEWGQKISGAEERIKNMEFELFDSIRKTILEDLAPLQTVAACIGELDCLQSLARVAHQEQWCAPQIEESGRLQITDGRHPVVETSLPPGSFIANDSCLDHEVQPFTLLTGPNMAGKSTYIRQVAIIVLLAQIGSFVPAREARIGLVDRIFTRIGSADNLAAGESTFMVEMIETAHIIRHATEKSLIVLDEVGRGTSTYDGLSIAQAICEHLVSRPEKPRTLFATHYHELTDLAEIYPQIQNATMSVREDRENIVFLRKVVPGSAERSYGIHVAQLAGLPATITQRAYQILEQLEAMHRPGEASSASPQAAPTPQSPREIQSLFDLPDPIIEALEALDANNLTPLEALNQIAKWKSELQQRIKT